MEENASTDQENQESSDGEKIGIVVTGGDSKRSLYFAAALGLEIDSGNIDFSTIAGAPEESYIHGINPEIKVDSVRDRIINIKQEMNESGRTFYTDEVQSAFQNFFQRNVTELCEKLENDSPEQALKFLEETLNESLFEHSYPEISVDFTDFDELNSDRYKNQETESDPENEENDDSEQADELKEHMDKLNESAKETAVLEISPVISVDGGTEIESFTHGEKIPVRLVNQSPISEQGNDDDLSESNSSPLIQAIFLNYRPLEEESIGILTVKLQDGILGKCMIPKGSLIKKLEDNGDLEEDIYEKRLETVAWIIASLLVLVLIFVYILIF